MIKKSLSFIAVVLSSFAIFPLSVMASSTITGAEYAGGVVSVRGNDFTAGTTYLVRVVDQVNGSVKALDQAIASPEGALQVNITTGALTNLNQYEVKINLPSGDLVASNDVDAAGVTPGNTGSSGSSNSGSGSVTSPVPDSAQGPAGTIKVTALTDTAGSSRAIVTDAQLLEALTRAVESTASGHKAAPIIIEIKAAAEMGKEISLELSAASMLALAESKVDTLIVKAGAVYLNFDKKAMEAMKGPLAGSNASGKVRIAISELNSQSALAQYPEEAKQNMKNKLGDRPLYNLSITAGDQIISDFKGGLAKVALPYANQSGENPHAVVIYYVDASGNLEVMPTSYYKPAAQTVGFQTKHFSNYAVGYNEIHYDDVSDHAWYKDAVTFAAARGITEGVSVNRFAPEQTITRGDFLVLLMRAYGIEADPFAADHFADAGSTYYTPFLGTAKKMGLVSGTGNNRFEPESSISRQDMVVMTYNVLESINALPVGSSHGMKMSDYKDRDEIGAYALKAMSLFVETNVISGSNGHLMPKDNSTRAETIQVLYNLLNNGSITQ